VVRERRGCRGRAQAAPPIPWHVVQGTCHAERTTSRSGRRASRLAGSVFDRHCQLPHGCVAPPPARLDHTGPRRELLALLLVVCLATAYLALAMRVYCWATYSPTHEFDETRERQCLAGAAAAAAAAAAPETAETTDALPASRRIRHNRLSISPGQPAWQGLLGSQLLSQPGASRHRHMGRCC